MHAPPTRTLADLLAIMASLRDPHHGCPWDKEQNFATIAPYTIEEAYEVADAATRRDFPALLDELGDLLFQVVYHARMAEEAGAFAFADVRRRHRRKIGPPPSPRVRQRSRPRRRRPHRSLGSPEGNRTPPPAPRKASSPACRSPLPALTRAEKLTSRAARVGFDWPDAEAVLAKLTEETAELQAELQAGDPDRLEDELGDIAVRARQPGAQTQTRSGSRTASRPREILHAFRGRGTITRRARHHTGGGRAPAYGGSLAGREKRPGPRPISAKIMVLERNQRVGIKWLPRRRAAAVVCAARRESSVRYCETRVLSGALAADATLGTNKIGVWGLLAPAGPGQSPGLFEPSNHYANPLNPPSRPPAAPPAPDH